MSRVTHIAYDEAQNKYYLRFSGEPFYATVEKLKSFGRTRARFDPDYTWPDGLMKAWHVDADVLPELFEHLGNLKWKLEELTRQQTYKQESLFVDDDVAEQARQEAIRQAQERARKAEEEARKRREEQLRQERERLRQEYASSTNYTYTPARVSDALKVLGLSGRVTKDDLKQAHRKLMLLHHPDKHMLASPDERCEHEQQSKKINAANDIVLEWLNSHEYVYA